MPPPERPAQSGADEVAAFLLGAGVAPDARLLDAPCGIGRRARALAERGFHVTAVDANPAAIDGLHRHLPKGLVARLECRASARESMPGLPADARFDALLCLDHAMGRGTRDEDVAFLGRLRGYASAGGLLLLELLHRDFFAARPRPFAYHVIGDIEQHEFRAFDPVTGGLDLTWRFYRREGEDLRFRGSSSVRLQLMTPSEAVRLLEAAGWRVEAAYGGWGKEGVSADRRKLLLLARAAARS